MINTIKIDGIVRERKSKTMFTNDYSEIEIQCYECGSWKEIKKLTNDHIVKKFNCRSCNMKATMAKKKASKKKTKKKVVKKKVSKKFKPYWPDDCPHRPFFKCKSPRECQGCYRNPEKKIALMARYGQPFEKGEKKTAKIHWFYSSKKHANESLKILNDIKNGKGLLKGGARSYFKYARKDEDD